MTTTTRPIQTEEQQVLASPCSSYWLKDAIKTLSQRDLVDAYYDAEALYRIIRARMLDAGLR